MIGVPPVDTLPLEKKRERPVRKGELRDGIVSLFRRTLETESRDMAGDAEEIEKLVERLDETGARLEREPTMAAFREYRELLSTVTKRIIRIAYRLDKLGGTPFDPRYHERVAVIDREADTLLRLVVSRQKKRLDIARKIMEIRGLVVDLLS